MFNTDVSYFIAYYLSRRSKENYFDQNNLKKELLKYWASSEEVVLLADEVLKIRGKFNLPTVSTSIITQNITGSVDSLKSAIYQATTQDFSSFLCTEQQIDPSYVASLQTILWCLQSSKEILEDPSSSQVPASQIAEVSRKISLALSSNIFKKISRRRLQQAPSANILVTARRSRFNAGVQASRLLKSLNDLLCLTTASIESALHHRDSIVAADSPNFSIFLCFAVAEAASIVSGLPIQRVRFLSSETCLIEIGDFNVSVNETEFAIPIVKLVSSLSDAITHLVWLNQETDELIGQATAALISSCRQSSKISRNLYEAPLNHCFIIVPERIPSFLLQQNTVNILDYSQVLRGGLIPLLKSVLRSSNIT